MENPTSADRSLEQLRTARTDLKTRHSQALAKLMTERRDLCGINPFADMLDDSLRWSACVRVGGPLYIASVIFKRIGEGRPYPEHGLTTRDWTALPSSKK